MKPVHRIVEVWWDDASAVEDERKVEDLQDDLYMCTVGYLVRETDRAVWVAAEVFEDGRMRGITRIPKGMVQDTRDLKRAAKRRVPRTGEPK